MNLLQEIHCELFSRKKLRVYVLRLDTIDTVTGGNKYFKLKYNLEKARELGYTTLLSFGGAYSNHIAALAAEGKQQGFKTIGVIRGEELSAESNPTLAAAAANGMHLHFVDREMYRSKNSPEVIESLKKQFGDFYLIPEGGSNALAVKGCMEIINYIDKPFDYIIAACGTGGTIAGIALSLSNKQSAIGIPVLKGAQFLERDIKELQEAYISGFSGDEKVTIPEMFYDYHFGGYAQSNPELKDFARTIENDFAIKLDPVYTAKSFYAAFDLMKKDHFSPDTSIVIVHTGGLQACGVELTNSNP